jgi:hypothetical protein
VSHSSFACDLFLRPLSRGLIFIPNANPTCSCVYICKFQFRPIHPPSRRLSITQQAQLCKHSPHNFEIINGDSDPVSDDRGTRPEPPWTLPPWFPTLARAVARPSPTHNYTIRHGEVARGEVAPWRCGSKNNHRLGAAPMATTVSFLIVAAFSLESGFFARRGEARRRC